MKLLLIFLEAAVWLNVFHYFQDLSSKLQNNLKMSQLYIAK